MIPDADLQAHVSLDYRFPFRLMSRWTTLRDALVASGATIRQMRRQVETPGFQSEPASRPADRPGSGGPGSAGALRAAAGDPQISLAAPAARPSLHLLTAPGLIRSRAVRNAETTVSIAWVIERGMGSAGGHGSGHRLPARAGHPQDAGRARACSALRAISTA